MSKLITNLTLPLVAEEIENILDTYHYHPYRQAFAIPELRQQLTTYVLNCVPACYALVEEEDSSRTDPACVPSSIRAKLQAAVVAGIELIVEENADWVCHHIPQQLNPAYAPSNWFG